MRVLAIDYGDARTGVAVSDAMGLMAGFTTVIHSHSAKEVLARLCELIRAHQADKLVMGYPRNMDGTEGPRAELYREFAKKLEAAAGMEVVLWDERRTTVDAHRILTETGNRGKKRKEKVDAVAASLILEGYLGFLRNNS